MTKDMQVSPREVNESTPHLLEMEAILLHQGTVIATLTWAGELLHLGEPVANLQIEVKEEIDPQGKEVKEGTADHSQEKEKESQEGIAVHSRVHPQQMELLRIPQRLTLILWRGKGASTRDKSYLATR